MSLKTYESIPDETVSLSGSISKTEKKPSFYLIGALLGMSIFAVGFISGSSSANGKLLSTPSLAMSNMRINSHKREMEIVSEAVLKAKWDELLENAGMTELEAAQSAKKFLDAEKGLSDAGINSFSSASSTSLTVMSALPASIDCHNPQVDLNFGLGEVYVCIGVSTAGQFAIEVSIKIATLEIFGYSASLGACGGTIPIPGLYPPGLSLDVDIDVSLCQNPKWIRVNVEPCVQIPIWPICTSVGTGKIPLSF